MKKKILLLTLLTSAFLLTGCSEEKIETPEEVKADVVYTVTKKDGSKETLKYSELKAIQEENEINWKNNYANRWVSFTGTVTSVGSYNSDIHIIIDGGMFLNIDDSASDSIRYRAESLKKGDVLTCEGTLGYIPSLSGIINVRCD